MLEEEGYTVVAEVGDGQQAVDQAQELRPDLVILDIQMPVLDGQSAAEQIAKARTAPGSCSPRSASASSSSGPATPGRWPTWSSRSTRTTWCPPSRSPGPGSPR